MPQVTINGVTFHGSIYDDASVRRAPQEITPTLHRFGVLHEAVNGARTFLLRGTKHEIEITWERVPVATRDAVRSIAALATTFVVTNNESGESWTVLCADSPLDEEQDVVKAGPVRYYNLTLTVLEV